MSTETRERSRTFNECVGFTVKQYLFHTDVKRVDVAHLIGVKGPNVTNKLQSNGNKFTVEELALIASLFGITVDDLTPTLEDGRWIPRPVKLMESRPAEEIHEYLPQLISLSERMREEMVKADSDEERSRPTGLYAIRDSNPGPTD